MDLDLDGKAAVSERSAHAFINDLAAMGYVAKQKDGRRNRYQTQDHLPLPGTGHGTWPAATSSPSSPALNPPAAQQPGK